MPASFCTGRHVGMLRSVRWEVHEQHSEEMSGMSGNWRWKE
jgi:hypothetical protein